MTHFQALVLLASLSAAYGSELPRDSSNLNSIPRENTYSLRWMDSIIRLMPSAPTAPIHAIEAVPIDAMGATNLPNASASIMVTEAIVLADAVIKEDEALDAGEPSAPPVEVEPEHAKFLPEASAPPGEKFSAEEIAVACAFPLSEETVERATAALELEDKSPSAPPLKEPVPELSFELVIEDAEGIEQRYNHVPDYVNGFKGHRYQFSPFSMTALELHYEVPGIKLPIDFTKEWLLEFYQNSLRSSHEPLKTGTGVINLPKNSPKYSPQVLNSKPHLYVPLRHPPLSKPRAKRVFLFQANDMVKSAKHSNTQTVDFGKYLQILNDLPISDTEDENDLAREESMVVFEAYKDSQLCFAGKAELVDQMFKSAIHWNNIDVARLQALMDKKKHLLLGRETIVTMLTLVFYKLTQVRTSSPLSEELFSLAERFITAGFLSALSGDDYSVLKLVFQKRRLMELVLWADPNIFRKVTSPMNVRFMEFHAPELAEMYFILGIELKDSDLDHASEIEKSLYAILIDSHTFSKKFELNNRHSQSEKSTLTDAHKSLREKPATTSKSLKELNPKK